jgi:hypothetical protein
MNTVLCVERLSQKYLSSSAQWVSRQLRESLFVIGGFSANQPFAPNSRPADWDNNTENALSAGFALKPVRHATFRLFPQSKGHESKKMSEFSRRLFSGERLHIPRQPIPAHLQFECYALLPETMQLAIGTTPFSTGFNPSYAVGR